MRLLKIKEVEINKRLYNGKLGNLRSMQKKLKFSVSLGFKNPANSYLVASEVKIGGARLFEEFGTFEALWSKFSGYAPEGFKAPKN